MVGGFSSQCRAFDVCRIDNVAQLLNPLQQLGKKVVAGSKCYFLLVREHAEMSAEQLQRLIRHCAFVAKFTDWVAVTVPHASGLHRPLDVFHQHQDNEIRIDLDPLRALVKQPLYLALDAKFR